MSIPKRCFAALLVVPFAGMFIAAADLSPDSRVLLEQAAKDAAFIQQSAEKTQQGCISSFALLSGCRGTLLCPVRRTDGASAGIVFVASERALLFSVSDDEITFIIPLNWTGKPEAVLVVPPRSPLATGFPLMEQQVPRFVNILNTGRVCTESTNAINQKQREERERGI